MKTKEIIGVDVSKLTLDLCIHSNLLQECFQNNLKGFKQMVQWVFKNTPSNKENTMFVFEHTGMYSYNLSSYLEKSNFLYTIVSGLDIKRSLGIVRGKSDQVDARRISIYGYRLREELKPYKPPENDILKIKSLFSLRDKLVKQRAGFKATLKEQKRIYKVKDFKIIFQAQQTMINILSKQIDKINKAIQEIIDENQKLKKTHDLITSIKSVGTQTAISMIVYTNCFAKFKTWRQFASYSGIAPFPFQSGSSLKGRTKVSHLANKHVKSILNMCAVSALQHSPEMKLYYHRKVAQGKNKMTVINAIRNKLIARMFAVVKRQTPYVETMKFAA